MPRRLVSTLGLSLAVAGYEQAPAGADVTPIWQRVQADPALERGRVVWSGNCRKCHAFGLEGAPRIGDPEAWHVRLEKGLPLLTENALRGYQGKAGGEMPARGGNAHLSDAEVGAAVTFMVAVSR